jgi:hypothetical protein
MTTYRGGAVTQDQQIPGESLACRNCGGMTSHANLAAHGGQCYPCYAAYCREAYKPRPRRPDSPAVADMKSRLKARQP